MSLGKITTLTSAALIAAAGALAQETESTTCKVGRVLNEDQPYSQFNGDYCIHVENYGDQENITPGLYSPNGNFLFPGYNRFNLSDDYMREGRYIIALTGDSIFDLETQEITKIELRFGEEINDVVDGKIIVTDKSFLNRGSRVLDFRGLKIFGTNEIIRVSSGKIETIDIKSMTDEELLTFLFQMLKSASIDFPSSILYSEKMQETNDGGIEFNDTTYYNIETHSVLRTLQPHISRILEVINQQEWSPAINQAILIFQDNFGTIDSIVQRHGPNANLSIYQNDFIVEIPEVMKAFGYVEDPCGDNIFCSELTSSGLKGINQRVASKYIMQLYRIFKALEVIPGGKMIFESISK